MTAEAFAEAERDPRTRTVVVAREGWHPGVVGIVAARLAERLHRPALVIALEGATGRGSGRSVRGVHLHGALASCSALLEAFGGHRQAVGFTVRRERIGELAARFEEAVAADTVPGDLEPVLELDGEVPFAMLTPGLFESLAALEPHGPGNPEPALVARGVEVEGVRRVGDPARPHLRLRLRQDGRTLPAIGFRLGDLPVRAGDRLDVAVRPRLTRWQGIERFELEVLDARAGHPQVAQAAGNTGEFGVP